MMLTPLLFYRFAPKVLERLLAKGPVKGIVHAPAEVH